MRIYKDFQFEAAHYLPSAAAGHPNSRVHGHSFRARVTIEGEPDPETGLILNLGDVSQALASLQEQLDHRFLNEVEGLDQPTLERISMWIWQRLESKFPGLVEVAVIRDSCQEGCIYSGPK